MDKTKENVELSKFYWKCVDILIGNGFKEKTAKSVIIGFIREFEPLSRLEI